MSKKLERYAAIGDDYPVPQTMQALVLSGVGMDNLRLQEVRVPQCGPNQLLARVDAVSACASDNKVIDQGSRHSLMYGWDVSLYPVIIGHEGSVTLMKVGENLKGKYHVGDRFAVQPAIPSGPYHYRERYVNQARGINKVAIGYTLPGLFSEYVLITEEVLDTGCLLPLPDEKIPYAGAALAEPLSCVIAAQERIVHVVWDRGATRRQAQLGPKREGTTLIIGAGPMGLMHVEVAMSYHPEEIIVSELLPQRLEKAKHIFSRKARELGIRLVCTHPDDLDRTIQEETDGRGVDDVIIALGIAKVQEKSLEYLARGGVTNFFGGARAGESLIQVDSRRIHYDGISVVGSSGSEPPDVARALEMIASGLIDPGNYIAKCGGLDAAISLIKAVREQRIDGKGVIYPHTESPLIDVQGWDLRKERKFLEEHLKLGRGPYFSSRF